MTTILARYWAWLIILPLAIGYIWWTISPAPMNRRVWRAEDYSL